jgi:uncharacterized membrane protein
VFYWVTYVVSFPAVWTSWLLRHINHQTEVLLDRTNDEMLRLRNYVLALLPLATSVTGLPQREDGLVACGEAFYSVDKVRITLSACTTLVRVLTLILLSTLAMMATSCAQCSMVCPR